MVKLLLTTHRMMGTVGLGEGVTLLRLLGFSGEEKQEQSRTVEPAVLGAGVGLL